VKTHTYAVVAYAVVATTLILSAACARNLPRTNDVAVGPVTAELREILEADQNEPFPEGEPADSAARVAFFTAHWTKHFKPRHDRVIEMIAQGALASAEDYFIAGMILNHGITAEDNLVAHALLTVAALKGHPEGRWASAAALDNFLTMVGHTQLFGTVHGDGRQVLGTPMTDALRREFCVPSLGKQEVLADLLRRGRRGAFDRQKVDCAPE
jgi:hypothetical protein